MRNTVCLKYFVDDCRRLRGFQGDTTEVVCLKLTKCKKIWVIIFVCRPPIKNNKYIFFSKLSISLNPTTTKYHNLLVICGLNIDILNKKKIMESILLIHVTLSL